MHIMSGCGEEALPDLRQGTASLPSAALTAITQAVTADTATAELGDESGQDVAPDAFAPDDSSSQQPRRYTAGERYQQEIDRVTEELRAVRPDDTDVRR